MSVAHTQIYAYGDHHNSIQYLSLHVFIAYILFAFSIHSATHAIVQTKLEPMILARQIGFDFDVGSVHLIRISIRNLVKFSKQIFISFVRCISNYYSEKLYCCGREGGIYSQFMHKNNNISNISLAGVHRIRIMLEQT